LVQGKNLLVIFEEVGGTPSSIQLLQVREKERLLCCGLCACIEGDGRGLEEVFVELEKRTGHQRTQ
jgi:hypothetical protein